MTLTLHDPVTGPRSESISWYRVRAHDGRLILSFRRQGIPNIEAVALTRVLGATIERDGEVVFDSRAWAAA